MTQWPSDSGGFTTLATWNPHLGCSARGRDEKVSRVLPPTSCMGHCCPRSVPTGACWLVAAKGDGKWHGFGLLLACSLKRGSDPTEKGGVMSVTTRLHHRCLWGPVATSLLSIQSHTGFTGLSGHHVSLLCEGRRGYWGTMWGWKSRQRTSLRVVSNGTGRG